MSGKTPLVYVIYYSTFGHVEKMAHHVVKGVERSGVDVKLFRVAETLTEDILKKMKAIPKPSDVPVIKTEQLTEPDGFLFGLPTRFGTTPAQLKALFDSCGSLWLSGALYGKFAGTFFSTATQGGGQETTALSCVPFFVHQGIRYVPLGYKYPKINNNEVVHGGSPWGAGTLANPDGSRQPTELELEMAEIQGFEFGNLMKQIKK
ncbi:unnamed protein product [Brachionus calyciflorus]|uniref:Flavodoxin-like domain-containing protein n=1 Tax=Brachionus calyciflorus TaxID=104777 RepID=A0A813MV91_9BILA|nr:unnamed protein product [Brachionus calyciflorus]